MSPVFYDDREYRRKQAELTRTLWREGKYDFKRKFDNRIFQNKPCSKIFQVKPHDKHKFCSSRCAALVNNAKRPPVSPETGKKSLSCT